MTDSPKPVHFSETHHAMLFGWIAKAVIEGVGAAQGEPALRRAVREYGEERGGRMRQRSLANGEALTMANYLVYGEWQGSPGASEVEVLERAPDEHYHITRCPWMAAWEGQDLLPYGRLYCQEIDAALVRGFNPALKLTVGGTLTNGAGRCEFVFHDAALVKPRSKPAGTTLPWEYHTGHLFATLERVLTTGLGEAGRTALQQGLAAFAGQYGEQAARIVEAQRGRDFSRPPEGQPGGAAPA